MARRRRIIGPGFPYLVTPIVAGSVGSSATWDPTLPAVTGSGVALSGGNLIVTNVVNSNHSVWATSGASTGQYYFEITVGAASNVFSNTIGLARAASDSNSYLGGSDGSTGMAGDGSVYGVTSSGPTGLIYATGDVVGVAVDFSAQLIWWRVNGGNWNGNSGYSPGGTGGQNLSELFAISSGPYFAAAGVAASGDVMTVNFNAVGPVGFGPFP